MELIAPHPTVTVSFGVSLPYDLFTTLVLLDTLGDAHEVGAWLGQTRARLPGALAARLHEVVGALRYAPLLWAELTAAAAKDPARRAFEPFLARLQAIPARRVNELALESVSQRLARWSLEPDPARRAPAALGRYRRRLVTYLDAIRAEGQARRTVPIRTEPDSNFVADLLLDGERLKSEMIAVVSEFWRGFYRARFMQDLPLLEAAVAVHARERYPSNFAELLFAVTGRTVPEIMGRSLDGITRVEFVPNALIGPYLVYTPAPPVMTIAFNALGPAARVEAQDTYPVARRLYPVLDALADHTRLRIVELLHRRECYAHEIAEAVSLSPSVISRHLQRLEQAGLVRVRRAGTSKFYSLDGDRGQALVTALQEMLSN